MYKDDEQFGQGTTDRDDLDEKHYDQYIGAEVLLTKDDLMCSGIVKRQKLNLGVNPVGKSNQNPILDTRNLYSQIPGWSRNGIRR